jgi:tRNA threonylcarbamoyladenosine biosynthesis protein TsaB
MTITLAIDASGADATVACLVDAACVAEGRAAMRHRDRETLLPLVLDVLRAAGMAPRDVHRIVVGEGPGAFTSLRIAAATAKGLVHGTRIRLAAVSSLVWRAASIAADGDRRLIATDALRGERFAQPVVRRDAGWTALGPVLVVPASALADLARQWDASPVDGDDGSSRVEARALVDVDPSAIHQVDAATWEPAYGRLAEAQVKWEANAGHPLPVVGGRVDVGASIP